MDIPRSKCSSMSVPSRCPKTIIPVPVNPTGATDVSLPQHRHEKTNMAAIGRMGRYTR